MTCSHENTSVINTVPLSAYKAGNPRHKKFFLTAEDYDMEVLKVQMVKCKNCGESFRSISISEGEFKRTIKAFDSLHRAIRRSIRRKKDLEAKDEAILLLEEMLEYLEMRLEEKRIELANDRANFDGEI